MKKYNIETIERFYVKCQYFNVKAKSKKEAVKLVKSGKVSYDQSEHLEGNEKFISLEFIEEVEDTE